MTHRQKLHKFLCMQKKSKCNFITYLANITQPIQSNTYFFSSALNTNTIMKKIVTRGSQKTTEEMKAKIKTKKAITTTKE